MARLGLAVVAAACVVGTATVPADAQQAPTTPGADVTADEASVLPPVVVNSPNEPVGARAKARRRPTPQQSVVTTSGAAAQSSGAVTGGDGGTPGDFAEASEEISAPAIAAGVFTLGQLDMIGGSTVTNEAMWTFNKSSLGQAVGILPGVTWASTGAPSINSSGARNEGDIFVRGFNRFQVPLSIDGVRVYLPADNRIDMNRFLTPDLSEAQVAKGYVSVLNGPGGMGGAINLVSRKPTKEVEIEGRTGAVFNGDLDDMNAWNAYAFAGTRQKGYYAQLSGNIVDQDHFNLSNDFTAASAATTPGYLNGFPYEQGGDRDRSNFQDWRINAKIGITPNATDEYSVNYTVQQGEKGAPLHVERQAVQGYFSLFNAQNNTSTQTARYWDWPQWDTSSLSWLSKTQLGEASYIKTNAYYNTFENVTAFYPDSQYLHPRIVSPYDDNSLGGFVELGTNLIPMNTLKGVVHYRRDEHNEGNLNYNSTTGALISRSPKETRSEETWSFAVENTFHATRSVDIVTGVSYDMNEVLRVDGNTDPKPELDAWNGQAAAVYSYSDTGKAHVSVSSRTRFPTLFERYSTRFGAKSADPNVQEERATSYEIGVSETLFRDLHVSTAVFYADIKDSIQTAFAGPNGMNSIVGFNADGENYGFEISADWDVMKGLRIGGNYTYLDRSLDFADAALHLAPNHPAANAAAAVAASQLEGTPRHEAFIYAAWKPFHQLTLTPSLELASDRTALITSCRSTLPYNNASIANNAACGKTNGQAASRPNYAQIGSYALVNFQAAYDFDANITATVGATNIFDQNYALADGFPEPGRQFFVNLRAKF